MLVEFNPLDGPETVRKDVFSLLNTGKIEDTGEFNEFGKDDLTGLYGNVEKYQVYPFGNVKTAPVEVWTYPGYIASIFNGEAIIC